jgi:DNA-binding IclR family transcriptional regulator
VTGEGEVELLTAAARVLLFVAETDRPSVKEIAASVGVTPDHVYRILRHLERAGYLTRHPQGKGKRNRYELHSNTRVAGHRTSVGDFVLALRPDRTS